MTKTVEETNKELVLEGFDTLSTSGIIKLGHCVLLSRQLP